jgi:pimeloyl-ACP methyl ester carboxylesterase
MAQMPFTEKRYLSPDGLSLYYRDYNTGSATKTPAVCLPGLTRNSKDFEDLATRLSATRRVLSPDLRGRGRSDYDSDFHRYVPVIYVGDVFALMAAESLARVVLIGTSLGGIISMLIAATNPACLEAVVLNDVGPEIAPEGAARIASYVGKMPPITTWAAAAAAQKTVNAAAFPDWTEADWMDFARRTFKDDGSGKPAPDYDSGIGRAFREPPAAPPDTPPPPAIDLWPVYSALKPIPTLAIRGALSDILAEKTFKRMKAEKPDLVQVTIPRVGHAPTLTEPQSSAAIDDFLGRLV